MFEQREKGAVPVVRVLGVYEWRMKRAMGTKMSARHLII